ncbi:unnamed protein product [Rotaria sordida]|uniref:Uncharacterized protein n=1 Tax=Rotaria sordida TaxID=392033 RepID=A0A819GYC3_9BILA|nr:unnamed protein product [Rotaria sordida]CAF1290108.1 unnamed protein product [Rotaria sordida]CAF3789476.1 unnamed protein product [Rotaria sordida]CAF3888733.1 unnamed protein product [Rotaria sordida]
MYYYSGIFWMLIYFILSVYGERDLFGKKCKRACDTKHGTFDCWKATTNGFTYGLSTAMIDYCEVILNLRQITHDKISWYNISRDILIQQIIQYDLDPKVHQLTKNDIQEVAISLLNKCFYTTSISSSLQPSCPSCSIKQINLIKQWRVISLFLISSCVLFIVIILFLYTFHTHINHYSYESIS